MNPSLFAGADDGGFEGTLRAANNLPMLNLQCLVTVLMWGPREQSNLKMMPRLQALVIYSMEVLFTVIEKKGSKWEVLWGRKIMRILCWPY